MKKIVILGSTGSIGRQTLGVVRQHQDKLKVIGLSGYKNQELLKKQEEEFKVKEISFNGKNLEKLASLKEADIVVVAVSGLAGLQPTLSAIRAGKRVCFANKEILVIAGKLVIKEALKYKAELIPIDSEISEIFQSLTGENIKTVKKIILTMGKGKLVLMDKERLRKVTLDEVCNRPVWDLGRKIAVDSATGVNKSLEVIEASRFFGIPYSQIEIMVHPQYLCHSLVEFNNGSLIGEFGFPDMKRYIQYAIFYPERQKKLNQEEFNLAGKTLTFEAPPFEKFPCLKLGFEALESGGTMPAVLHGADEIAVGAYLDGKIRFTDIYHVIQKTMEKHKVIKNPSLEQLIEAEKWGRVEARKYL